MPWRRLPHGRCSLQRARLLAFAPTTPLHLPMRRCWSWLYSSSTAYPNCCTEVRASLPVHSHDFPAYSGHGRVDGMLKETMLFATQQRYNALVQAAEPSGACRTRMSRNASCNNRHAVAGLARLIEQLVSDIVDDVEHYNAAIPATCNLSLPQLSCR